MAKKVRIQVQSSCRDCAMCTGTALAGVGRSAGRGLLNVATAGVAAIARPMCRLCGHPMSEHEDGRPPAFSYTAEELSWAPASWIKQEDGRLRWWDGRQWTEHFHGEATTPEPAVALEAQGTSGIDGLAALIDYRERGLLSEEEFAAAKRKLLGL